MTAAAGVGLGDSVIVAVAVAVAMTWVVVPPAVGAVWVGAAPQDATSSANATGTAIRHTGDLPTTLLGAGTCPG